MIIPEKHIRNELHEINEDLLRQGFSVRITMRGTSMLPFIKQGDIALVSKTDIGNVRKGDIIVFKIKNDYIAHRLIKKNMTDLTVITKGDSCKQYDTPVAFQSVTGKISRIQSGKKTMDMDSVFWRVINTFMATFPFCTHYMANFSKIPV